MDKVDTDPSLTLKPFQKPEPVVVPDSPSLSCSARLDGLVSPRMSRFQHYLHYDQTLPQGAQRPRVRTLDGTASCPATPDQRRRRFVRDGATQLTSLTTLLTHHRHMFLFDDVLLISKRKGPNSYKFKEKVLLQRLWVSSNNCTHSFLIGWPGVNYVAHFSSESEKDEWLTELTRQIKLKLTHTSTTVSVNVKVDGRQQVIRHELENGITASNVLAELVDKLNLGSDPNMFELHVESDPGGSVMMHGIENVYAVLMDRVQRLGLAFSDSVLQHLDTCPMIRCGLVIQACSVPSPPTNLVNQVKKAILARVESKKLFGRKLEGSMPPQPVLTMIDYLSLHALDVEGIFRKSPKQSTVRQLRLELDHGQVPNFGEYSPHVTASLLKDYLRSIPGQLLLSGNYNLWMDACFEADADKQLEKCQRLLCLLPPSHTVLLRSVLRLLRRVSHNGQSKMTMKSLAVCIAPSLLENPVASFDASVKKVPDLAEYLIENAPRLFDNFEEDGPLLPNAQLNQSTDSGLSCDALVPTCQHKRVESPDSALMGSPISECSANESEDTKRPQLLPERQQEDEQRNQFESRFIPVQQHERVCSTPVNEEGLQNRQQIVPQRKMLQDSYHHKSVFESRPSYNNKMADYRTPPYRAEPLNWDRFGSLRSSCSSTYSSHNPLSPVFSTNRKAFASETHNHRKEQSGDSTCTLVSRTPTPERSASRLSRFNEPHGLARCTHASLSAAGNPKNNNNNNSALCRPECRDLAAKPPLPAAARPHSSRARPLRRTADEVMLGNLEVNWSVPSIRSVFQNNQDLKPTHIDTVYATLDLIQKQSK